MALADQTHDPALIFTRTHRLGDGVRVRLRLARPGDELPVGALLGRLGYTASEPELLSLVRFDPHQRAVICASALIGARPHVIAFGAIDLNAPRAQATVVVDPAHAAEVTGLVRVALEARADAHAAQARAAAA